MSRPHRVDEVLAKLSDADEYRAMLRKPVTTIDHLQKWLDEHGEPVSRGAIWKHRRKEQEVLDSVRRSAEMTRAFIDLARSEGASGNGIAGFSDAALLRLSQVVMDLSMRIDIEGEVDPQDLMRLTQSLRNLIGGKREVEELKRQQRDAIAEAERAVDAGGSAQTVVDTIKRALGIAA